MQNGCLQTRKRPPPAPTLLLPGPQTCSLQDQETCLWPNPLKAQAQTDGKEGVGGKRGWIWRGSGLSSDGPGGPLGQWGGKAEGICGVVLPGVSRVGPLSLADWSLLPSSPLLGLPAPLLQSGKHLPQQDSVPYGTEPILQQALLGTFCLLMHQKLSPPASSLLPPGALNVSGVAGGLLQAPCSCLYQGVSPGHVPAPPASGPSGSLAGPQECWNAKLHLEPSLPYC